MKFPGYRYGGSALAARLAGVLIPGILLAWPGAAGAQDLQVIELHHRLADEVIPTLQPLLAPGGVVTGMDAMLFVRTSPGNLEQIRQAVALLDRKPRQLLISVGQGTVATEREAAVRGAATVGSGDVQVGVNRPPGNEPGVAVQARQVAQRADLRNVSTVRTLEGAETLVSIGQSAPITTTQVSPGWAGPTVVQTTEYREVSTGFYATARLSGERVTLEIAPRQQHLSGPASDRRVESAGITTQVSGLLGEWLPVGGSSETSRDESSGLLNRGTRSTDARYSVWVKVEEAP